MASTTQPDDELGEALNKRVRGTVLQPGGEGYDDARTVWNGMIDKRPRAIARCTGAADVMAAVRFANERDLLLAVRGGGHNVAGKAVCDDGLVIDLSEMDSVHVDPSAKRARVGPGATWGDFDHEAQAHGLATTGGFDSRTGVAGLTLGGGIGYLARSVGLACDNLVGADVVTADGELVHANATEHPDLFWGLRGGGGNFGVVTSFEFQLHEVGPEVLTAQVFYPIEAGEAVLERYREVMASAPDELACYCFAAHVPPEEPFPEAHHGEPTLILVAPFFGPEERGRELLDQLTGVADPIVEMVQPMPYTMLQSSFDDATPEGERYYWKSHYLDAITDDLIETFVEYTDPIHGPMTVVGFEPMGGAINRVDADETAYPHRDAAFNFGIFAGWSDPSKDDEVIDWTREFHEAMAPFATGGVYTNYLDTDESDRVEAAYRENYDRLVELKNEWDPENRFRLNSNVEPTG